MITASPEAKKLLDQGLTPQQVALATNMLVLQITLAEDIAKEVREQVAKGMYFMKGNSGYYEGHSLLVHFLEPVPGTLDEYYIATQDYGVMQ